MNAINWVDPLLKVLAILGYAAGLWVAGRLLPGLTARLAPGDLRERLANPLVQVVLWLALGGLFSLPLQDMVGWLGNLANVALPLQNGGGVATVLGLVPPRVYSLFPMLLLLAVYGVTLWLVRGLLPAQGPLDAVERTFTGLAAASLIYRGLEVVFNQVIFFSVPVNSVPQTSSVATFLLEILTGGAILGVMLVVLNRMLFRRAGEGPRG